MRIIDADAMKRVYQEVLCNHVACIDCSFFMDDEYCKFETMLSEAPTVDAVPVVRCKDCKHRYSDSWCEYVDDDDNFYCARGERKEGADNELYKKNETKK